MSNKMSKGLGLAIAGVCLSVLSGCGDPGTVTLGSTTTPVSAPAKQIWVSAWAESAIDADNIPGTEQTYREIVKPTVGSRGTVRLHFSNFFSTSPVTIGAVHIAVQTTGAGVKNDVPVTFLGGAGVIIPAGGYALSDAVTMKFDYGDVLAVTEYISGSWTGLNEHPPGTSTTSYVTNANAGNKTADLAGTSFSNKTLLSYLVDRVDVYGDYTATIAAFGSSTTAGVGSPADQHLSWPDQLAARLHAAGRDDIGVANSSTGGRGIVGPALLDGTVRFGRDVLSLPGIAAVIDYLGANDLRSTCYSASLIIQAKQNLIAQAHAAGVKVFMGTIGPSTFCGVQTPVGYPIRFAQPDAEEKQRFLLNAWIQSTQASTVNGLTVAAPTADAIIDFSSAIADPADPDYLRLNLDSGDDVHLNAAGYGVMAQTIPLSLF